jgi:hypothetical protein
MTAEIGLAQVELRGGLPGSQALTEVLPDKLADLDNQGWLGGESWNGLLGEGSSKELSKLVQQPQRDLQFGSGHDLNGQIRFLEGPQIACQTKATQLPVQSWALPDAGRVQADLAAENRGDMSSRNHDRNGHLHDSKWTADLMRFQFASHSPIQLTVHLAAKRTAAAKESRQEAAEFDFLASEAYPRLGQHGRNELGCEAGELVEFGKRTTEQGSLDKPV